MGRMRNGWGGAMVTGQEASWGVAALVDEPAALIAAFAAYHLERGAAQVHLCLDRPNPEARDLLAALPGVVVTESGADGWRFHGVGKRPQKHLGRQKYHASRVLAETKLDWIVHCDADEFVQPVAGESIGAALGAVRQGASWAKIPVAERAHLTGAPEPDLFQGVFRLPWDDFESRGARIYGDATMLLLHGGLCGHRLGKAAVRSGRGLFAGVHRPMRDWKGADREIPVEGLKTLKLLHFDGLTELHYALKMMRRALNALSDKPPSHGASRRLQYLTMAEEATNVAHLHEQYAATKAIDAEQAEALEKLGVLGRWQPEIAERTARVFGRAIDLSPAAFDRALLRHEREMILRAAQTFGFDPLPLVSSA